MKRKTRQFVYLLILLLFLETIAILAKPQWVRSQTPSIDLVRTEVEAFEPPPEDGEPDNTAGGGSRNEPNCLSQDVTMTLTPVVDDLTYHFSIALPHTSARSLAIKIEDDNENLLYYDTLDIENSPKNVTFNLPENSSSLEVGKPYKWTLSAICSEAIDPNDPTFEGVLVLTNILKSSALGID